MLFASTAADDFAAAADLADDFAADFFSDFFGGLPRHAQLDYAVESGGQFHQLGRRPGVQAEFVNHRNALLKNHFDNSRWRTWTLKSSPANRSRSRSATYTERWKPPVQPMATVK